MKWLWLSSFALALATPAYAQDGKIKKAQKMLAKYEAGKTSAFAKAWEAIQAAKEHPDTRDNPTVWVIIAEMNTTYGEEPGLDAPEDDMWEPTWRAWDTAIGKGAGDNHAEAVLEGLGMMEATAYAQGTNAFESEDYGTAWDAFDRVMRCQRLIRQVGRVDSSRELSVTKMALVTATKLDQLDDARDLHTALVDLGGRRTGTTLTVAKAIEAIEGNASALAFLEPFASENPKDASMFALWAEYLIAAERQDDLQKALETHAELVGNAPAITLVHAQSWAMLRELDRAAEAYEAAARIDGQNQEVLRSFAALLVKRGKRFDEQAKATRKWRERKQLRADRDAAFERAKTLLETSRDLEPGHLPTLEALLEAWELAGFDDKDERMALEEAIGKAKDKAQPE